VSESLRRRVEKLERRPGCRTLDELTAEALQQRLDLLLTIVVYDITGRDATAPRRELETLGRLPLPPCDRDPIDEAGILGRALEVLRSEPEREDYRKLLAMMAAGPVGADQDPEAGQ
jgi:hypothetical protein